MSTHKIPPFAPLIWGCFASLALACGSNPENDGAGGSASGGSGGSGPSGGAQATGGDSAQSGGAPSSGASGGSNSGGGSGGAQANTGGTQASSGGAQANTGGNDPGTGGGTSGAFLSATELIADLTLGWNLGNTLDAPEGETAWGNPVATPALFAAVRSAGFDTVRIPVTWSLYTGAGPDFTIDPSFLARVEEVVGYARQAGLTSIINVHHDGADGYEDVEWLTLNDPQGNVTQENNEAVEARFVAVWTQLAEHFKDADGSLLFESMNEIHDGYDAPDPVYYTILNDLNQTFVDLVRASGGNNAERCLVVPGYNTNIDYTLQGFELPTDSTSDRLILSVHFYDPWPFAGEGSTSTWGAASPGNDGWGQEDFVVEQYDKLESQFVSQGIPMIVGEYGAVRQEGSEEYRRYYMEYVTKVIVDRGIVPYYWDNGGEGSGMDAFGLISRSDGTILRPVIVDAMVRAATDSYSLADVAPPAL